MITCPAGRRVVGERGAEGPLSDVKDDDLIKYLAYQLQSLRQMLGRAAPAGVEGDGGVQQSAADPHRVLCASTTAVSAGTQRQSSPQRSIRITRPLSGSVETTTASRPVMSGIPRASIAHIASAVGPRYRRTEWPVGRPEKG
jgi:hypothetical protein